MSGPVPAPAIGAGRLFRVFLGLGLRGFGGPMAHLALFRREFVDQRGWIAADRYDALVALAQLVPGPASSQVGVLLGWRWAGWRGALAAFAGFTLPSAVLMAALGMGWATGHGSDAGAAVLRGLMLAAVVVVLQAVVTMLRSTGLQPLPLVAAVIVAMLTVTEPFEGAAMLALVGSAILGALRPSSIRGRPVAFDPPFVPRSAARWAAVGLGGLLLVSAAVLHAPVDLAPAWGVAMANLQSGAFVFGGGHVVLPLLQAGTVTPGWVSPEAFTVGYGAAQALPGPMFAFAAYLGAAAQPGPWAAGSALGSLIALFLPGFVWIVVAQAHAARLFASTRGLAALGMVNAAVIGLLAGAGWHLVIDTRVALGDVPALGIAFVLLMRARRGAFWAAVICVAYTLAVAIGAG